MRFSPRAYQLQAIDHLAAHPRCALWAGMGMGKTVSTLTALDTLALAEEDIFPALVIAPLRVARSTWPAEIGKWAHLRHLRISPIVGDQRSRKSAMSTQADIYTTNYEQLPWILRARRRSLALPDCRRRREHQAQGVPPASRHAKGEGAGPHRTHRAGQATHRADRHAGPERPDRSVGASLVP